MGQLWGIIKGTTSLTRYWSLRFINFRLKGHREPGNEVGSLRFQKWKSDNIGGKSKELLNFRIRKFVPIILWNITVPDWRIFFEMKQFVNFCIFSFIGSWEGFYQASIKSFGLLLWVSLTRGHSFSTYGKFSEKLWFLTPLIRTCPWV